MFCPKSHVTIPGTNHTLCTLSYDELEILLRVLMIYVIFHTKNMNEDEIRSEPFFFVAYDNEMSASIRGGCVRCSHGLVVCIVPIDMSFFIIQIYRTVFCKTTQPGKNATKSIIHIALRSIIFRRLRVPSSEQVKVEFRSHTKIRRLSELDQCVRYCTEFTHRNSGTMSYANYH